MADLESKSNQISYRRVGGMRRTLTLSRAALFTADDHFLLCDYRSGFTERYKRFYFRDIEAIILRKTIGWLFGITAWVLIGLLFLMIGTSASWNKWTTLTIEGVCAIFFLRGLLRGPSCRAHIQTAVQTDLLPMFKRVRKTRRVLGRTIFPLIEQAQGKVETAPSLPQQQPLVAARSANVPESSTTPAAAESTTPPIPVLEQPVAMTQKLSWLHVATFGVVFLGGLNAIWEVNYPSIFAYGVCVTLFGLSVIGGIASLIWQGKHRVHRGAATMIWFLVITFVVGGGILDYVYTMSNFVAQVDKIRTSPPRIFHFLTPFQLRAMPGFNTVLWTYGIWSVLLGLFGLVFIFLPAPAKAQPPPLPAKDRA